MESARVICTKLFLFCVLLQVVLATYDQIADPLKEYALPKLPYEFAGLEPFIDEATVRVHLEGHHATYTNNLNTALESWRKEFPEDKLANQSILYILQNVQEVPAKLKTTIINQGGGYLNHCLYWACMSSNPNKKERKPKGKLLKDIKSKFGSYENLQDEFTAKAKTLFGSGYVWLSRDIYNGELVLSTTANQDSPVSEGLRPILTLDVWEHAYYLKFQYLRMNYVVNWWRVVDWYAVAQLDSWWQKPESRKKDEL